MTSYTSEAIRNIALVGHSGAGKTTLSEALLHRAGAIPAPGSVEAGNTVSDFDPQERTLQHSLDASVLSLDSAAAHINLLDTPGLPDFAGRAFSVLPAVETMAVVVDATLGVEMVTERMMEAAKSRRMCRLLVVNKIDHPEADLPLLLELIQERFGPECLPINLPAGGREAVVDCFFNPGGGETEISSVEEAHTRIIDQVVEVDEALMETYLEQGQDLDPAQLHDPFEQALRDGHLVPVCFVSARTGAGVDELLHVFERLMPNPSEGNPPPFLKGEGAQARPVEVVPDPERHVIAHVFKVNFDPFVGKQGVFRVHQGTVTPNTQLFVGDGRKPFKVTHLLKLMGGEHREIGQAIPGDICAVAKVEEVHFDAVLHDSHEEDHFHLQSMACPAPMYGLAVSIRKRGDEKKLSDALHKVDEEDPCLVVEQVSSANETVLRGLGELHLRVVLDRIAARHNLEMETRPPSIAYRETITAPAEGHHRHKKQTGGAGQFGEVFLRVEPLERGAGFEFLDKVVGGAIPQQFIPAVEKGVRQALSAGAIAGYPLQDLRVTVYDGKHHSVDSKEVAFIAAGKKAFIDAIKAARPVVLEPIVRIGITAPSANMGDITGDLSGMRGRINGTDSLPGGRVSIEGQVPLAELGNYQSRLKSLTGGEGSYVIELSHYEPVPAKTQQELMARFQPQAEEE